MLFRSRELDIINLVCAEKTNEEIAQELFISPGTVAVHRHNINEKTGAKSSLQLYKYLVKEGWV